MDLVTIQPNNAVTDDDSILSIDSTNDSFYQLSPTTPNANGDTPQNIEVVKIASRVERPNSALTVPNLFVNESQSGGLSMRNDSSGLFPSLQASPVKKDDNTVNSIDCSFLGFKSIDIDANNEEEEKKEGDECKETRWVEFEPTEFQPASTVVEDDSNLLGARPKSQEETGNSSAFSPVIFADIKPTLVTTKILSADGFIVPADADEAKEETSLVQQMEELKRRLVLLEEQVRAGTHVDDHPTQISDSSSNDHPQDVAFIEDGAELLMDSSLGNDETDLVVKKEDDKVSTKRKGFTKRMLNFFRVVKTEKSH